MSFRFSGKAFLLYTGLFTVFYAHESYVFLDKSQIYYKTNYSAFGMLMPGITKASDGFRPNKYFYAKNVYTIYNFNKALYFLNCVISYTQFEKGRTWVYIRNLYKCRASFNAGY